MSDRSENCESRIAKLEMAVAYQQRLCEQLDAVVCQNTKQLLALQRTLADFETRLKELLQQRKQPPTDPAEEKPPHY